MSKEDMQGMVNDLLAAIEPGTALDSQHGGDHYKKMGAYQPWAVLPHWLTPDELRGFAKGTVVAYLARERDKGGLDDLWKSLHTLQLYRDTSPTETPPVANEALSEGVTPYGESGPDGLQVCCSDYVACEEACVHRANFWKAQAEDHAAEVRMWENRVCQLKEVERDHLKREEELEASVRCITVERDKALKEMVARDSTYTLRKNNDRIQELEVARANLLSGLQSANCKLADTIKERDSAMKDKLDLQEKIRMVSIERDNAMKEMAERGNALQELGRAREDMRVATRGVNAKVQHICKVWLDRADLLLNSMKEGEVDQVRRCVNELMKAFGLH